MKNFRNFLPTSQQFDHVEIVRDAKIIKTIPREKIDAEPKPEPLPRNAMVLVGAIREYTEMIIKVNTDGTQQIPAWQRTLSHAERILKLLTELDAALINEQYAGSLKGRR
jgi:hypothetical protein